MNQQYEPQQAPIDNVIALLSDDEVARVNAQAADNLSDFDEYLDLEQPAKGVQRGPGSARPICRVLPRSALRASTWAKILAWLGTAKRVGRGSPANLTR